jgi:hypothetical protein
MKTIYLSIQVIRVKGICDGIRYEKRLINGLHKDNNRTFGG